MLPKLLHNRKSRVLLTAVKSFVDEDLMANNGKAIMDTWRIGETVGHMPNPNVKRQVGQKPQDLNISRGRKCTILTHSSSWVWKPKFPGPEVPIKAHDSYDNLKERDSNESVNHLLGRASELRESEEIDNHPNILRGEASNHRGNVNGATKSIPNVIVGMMDDETLIDQFGS